MNSFDSAKAAGRIAAKIPAGGLFAEKEWRISPVPFPLPASLHREIEKLGYRLHKFLEVSNLLYRLSVKGKMPSWIAELLDQGKPPELIAISRDPAFRVQIPDIIRPDLIPTPNGFIVSEIDSVPGGIGLTAWLNKAYSEEGLEVIGGGTGMLDGFSSILPDGGDIFVSEEAATYRPEMEWLAETLNAGHGDSGKFQVRDQNFQGPWKKNVYRFFELFDLPNLPAAESLLARARNGELRLTAPPKPFLEEKLLFALFWLRPLEKFWMRQLGSRTFSILRRCFPRTWILDPSPLPHLGVYPGIGLHDWKELKELSQRDRHLVIKVSGFSEEAWGGRGVQVGHDLSHADWAKAVEAALVGFHSRPCILQEFHAGEIFPCTYLDEGTGQTLPMKGRARLCPYYFSGKTEHPMLGGILATICPADKKLLHGMRDAVMAPVSTSRI